MNFASEKRVAVLIPCYNEERTIGQVVRQFRAALQRFIRARPAGSHSKIRLLHDGFVILNCILVLLRDYKR